MKDCFVYLSGPITAKHGFSVEDNVASALKAYWECLQSGIPAFCPHLSAAFPTGHVVIGYEAWMAYDFVIIDRSTHVLMLPRWETSSGARRELEYAHRRGLPSFFALSELRQALEAVDPVAALASDLGRGD